MRFGVGMFELPGGETGGDRWFADLLALARAGEALGFDSLWIGARPEEGERGSVGPVVAAALAGATRWLRLGLLVPIGTAHPLALAEEIAVLDQITGGRVMCAFVPARAVASSLGSDVERHARRVAESVAIIRLAWAPGAFSWDGEEYRIPARLLANDRRTTDRVSVTPKPRQPGLPVWLDTRLPGAAALARHHRIPLLGGLGERSRGLAGMAEAREAVEGTGSQVRDPGPAIIREVRVVDGPDWVTRGEGRELQGGERADEVASPAGDSRIVGDATTCVEAIRALAHEAGVTELICSVPGPAGGVETTIRAADRIAREIVPHFRTAHFPHAPAAWSSLVHRLREREDDERCRLAWTSG